MHRAQVGERIQEIRIAKNLTRDQLASKSGLSPKFLYEIETGRKGLSVESLFKIANGLSCNYEEILSENRDLYL